MRLSTSARAVVLATVASTALAGGLVIATGGAAASATCSDIEVVFARGTGELPGLGMVGTPFVSALSASLPGYSVSSYAVNYSADFLQLSSTSGARDMGKHVQAVAAACPGTRFVLGGYSQGATVTDKAIGISTFMSAAAPQIPANLTGRVAAVVVFGNPLGMTGGTIASRSTTYGARSHDYCNQFDFICGGNVSGASGGHLAYSTNGSTTAGAQFAAGLIRSSVPAGSR
jgi:cutinase